MKHRIRATFSPPAQWLRAGALPEQVEHISDSPGDMAEKLRELVMAGDKLLRLKARLVIEIAPIVEQESGNG